MSHARLLCETLPTNTSHVYEFFESDRGRTADARLTDAAWYDTWRARHMVEQALSSRSPRPRGRRWRSCWSWGRRRGPCVCVCVSRELQFFGGTRVAKKKLMPACKEHRPSDHHRRGWRAAGSAAAADGAALRAGLGASGRAVKQIYTAPLKADAKLHQPLYPPRWGAARDGVQQ
jgi:hypothetical protein